MNGEGCGEEERGGERVGERWGGGMRGEEVMGLKCEATIRGG